MFKVIYCKEGKAFSDFNLLEEAQNLINDYSSNKIVSIKVSTDNIIQALRVLASREKLNFDEIVFIFNEYEITMNDKYELSKYPSGFMDWEMKFLRELIQKRRSK